MDASIKQTWVAALRSGKYMQNRGSLYDYDGSADAYCCIGVGFVACINDEITEAADTETAARRLGISRHEKKTLVRMNDSELNDFHEIADYIEANL